MEYAVLIAMLAVTLMAVWSANSAAINRKFKTVSDTVDAAGR